MAYRETDIVREGARHFIIRRAVGRYEVLRHAGTHSIVCGRISFPGDDAKALTYANRDFDRREAGNA